MRRSWRGGGLFALMVVVGGQAARAADDASAILAKGIEALGGRAKLTKATAGMIWRAEGTLTVQGNDNEFKIQATVGALDRVRTEFEGDFDGQTFRGSVVLDGPKGYRKLGAETTDLEGDALAQEKRNQYLQIIPVTLVPLLDKGFKVEADGEEKVDDQPASVLKVTGPDGKPFRLLLDKATGLPLKMTATVVGMGGDEYDQATTFAEYRELGGIKKATRIRVTRDGEPFLRLKVEDFRVADPPADAFAAPK